MHWYNTNGQGNVIPAGVHDDTNDAMCGVNVIYDVGKIFSAGGSQFYHLAPGLKVAHLVEIIEVGQEATVEQLPDMHYARAFASAVVLSDGKILITGGSRLGGGFTDKEPVFVPKLFDPVQQTLTELVPGAIPRNYHSVSILLADGTVFSGGGGLCYDNGSGISEHCRNTVDHPNGQIFTPPYLLTDTLRPVITTVVGPMDNTVSPGGELRVTMEGPAEGVQFSLVRIGSVTHNINSDQKRVPLTPVTNGAEAVLTLPEDAEIVLAGAWFLFALSHEGVPSVAKTVWVQF